MKQYPKEMERDNNNKSMLTRNDILVSVFLDILRGESSGLWRASDHWDRLDTP